MGFRSMVMTGDTGIKWPLWFVYKYSHSLRFTEESAESAVGNFWTPIERKFYGSLIDLETDIAKVLAELKDAGDFHELVILIWLHECGGVTRAEIRATGIRRTEPTAWRTVRNITHDYCYGCSDASKAINPVGNGELEKGDRQ